MLSLSRTTWSRKGVAMVLDTKKLKNRKSVKKSGMRGRDAAKEFTLKVNIWKVFTSDFSETKSIVNHNSRSDGQRNSKDTKDNGISPWISQAKNAPMRLRPDFRAAVSLKNRLHRESGGELAEPISPQQFWRWHPSSSDSWWDTSEWSWWSS